MKYLLRSHRKPTRTCSFPTEVLTERGQVHAAGADARIPFVSRERPRLPDDNIERSLRTGARCETKQQGFTGFVGLDSERVSPLPCACCTEFSLRSLPTAMRRIAWRNMETVMGCMALPDSPWKTSRILHASAGFISTLRQILRAMAWFTISGERFSGELFDLSLSSFDTMPYYEPCPTMPHHTTLCTIQMLALITMLRPYWPCYTLPHLRPYRVLLRPLPRVLAAGPRARRARSGHLPEPGVRHLP